MDNLRIYSAAREVPKEAQRPITAGRIRGFTDINPMWRIKKLTELYGPCGTGWYYDPIKQWIEEAGDEKAAFVNLNLYVKDNGEWSKPIFGTGGSAFYAMEKGGLYMSDEKLLEMKKMREPLTGPQAGQLLQYIKKQLENLNGK